MPTKRITKANCPHINTFNVKVGKQLVTKCTDCGKAWGGNEVKRSKNEKHLETDPRTIESIRKSVTYYVKQLDTETAVRLGAKIGIPSSEIVAMVEKERETHSIPTNNE